MICGSGGSKSRLAKMAGAEPSGRMRDEKMRADVAPSTFPRQNVQNTSGSDLFWKLRCQKSARSYGAKHTSKSKCTKHTMFGPLLEVDMLKKCTLLWHEAHLQVKNIKKTSVSDHIWSCDVEKVHAVVARSIFRSQHVQNNSVSERFWKLRCRKSARRCGAKHMSKSKCTKHLSIGPLLEVEMSKKCAPSRREAHVQVKMYKKHQVRTAFGSWDLRCRKSARCCGAQHMSRWKCTKHLSIGPLLEVEMSKKCTPLWREAHVQVKMQKTHQLRTTFGSWDVEKVYAVVAQSTCRSQKWKKLKGLEHFWTFGYRCTWHAQGILHLPKSGKNWGLWQFQVQPLHYTTLHYTTLHCTTATTTTTTTHQLQVQLQPQLQLQLQLQLHYATLHYTKYTTLHSTSLHCTTFNYPMLHYNYITATTITTTTTTLRYTSYTALH